MLLPIQPYVTIHVLLPIQTPMTIHLPLSLQAPVTVHVPLQLQAHVTVHVPLHIQSPVTLHVPIPPYIPPCTYSALQATVSGWGVTDSDTRKQAQILQAVKVLFYTTLLYCAQLCLSLLYTALN